MKVLEYLSNVIIATPQMIIEATNVEPHDIRRMITDGILTSSLNYNHNWLIATKVLNKRKDHWGFYRHRIKKYDRTMPIFHIKRTAKATLSYLASGRPWGITSTEAEELLGRDCIRALNDLVKDNAIQERLSNGEKIFLHRVHKRADIQLKNRQTNPRFRKDEEEDDDKQEVGVVTYEEFCKVFKLALSEMDEHPDVSDDRMSALLLMFTTSRTFRTSNG